MFRIKQKNHCPIAAYARRAMGFCLALLLIAAPIFNAVWAAAEETPADETTPVQLPEEDTQLPEEDTQLPEEPETPEEPTQPPEEPEEPETPEEPPEEEPENPPEVSEEHMVLLYDVEADGFGAGVPALILSVSDGGTILDALAQTDDSVFADGTAAADCVYYALDAAGRRMDWELTAPVTEALSLYTYSYTLSVIYDVSISAKDDWTNMGALPRATRQIRWWLSFPPARARRLTQPRCRRGMWI